ncbi:MAG: helix-turn-helix transcriptional regulator [Flavisolibacter sp.]|nr:helix-turn-helix transcriptional regulator [Flavisolibacter sp.]
MSPKELTREERERIHSVKMYLLNHLDQQFTVEQLARRAALGIQKFKDGFYTLFEMPVGAYIHEARMKQGRVLLRNSDKSIKEIAMLCGYSKARNFSSAYKKFFGVRPGEERN